MNIGDNVRCKFGSKEGLYGRKAVIVDIDRLSETGSHPDLYTVRMFKDGSIHESAPWNIEKWPTRKQK